MGFAVVKVMKAKDKESACQDFDKDNRGNDKSCSGPPATHERIIKANFVSDCLEGSCIGIKREFKLLFM